MRRQVSAFFAHLLSPFSPPVTIVIVIAGILFCLHQSIPRVDDWQMTEEQEEQWAKWESDHAWGKPPHADPAKKSSEIGLGTTAAIGVK